MILTRSIKFKNMQIDNKFRSKYICKTFTFNLTPGYIQKIALNFKNYHKI